VRSLVDGFNSPTHDVDKLDLYQSADGQMAQFMPFYYGFKTPSLNVLGDPIQTKALDSLTDRWLFAAHREPDAIIAPLAKNGLWIPGPKKTTAITVNDQGEMKTLNDAGDEAWRSYVVARGEFLKQFLTPDVVYQLANMDRLTAQSILDGPSINAAANHYASAVVQQLILDKKIKINS
jgi:hypothetical protein